MSRYGFAANLKVSQVHFSRCEIESLQVCEKGKLVVYPKKKKALRRKWQVSTACNIHVTPNLLLTWPVVSSFS
jgi:hypothetical protein